MQDKKGQGEYYLLYECDEAKPVCRKCERIGKPCIYDRPGDDEARDAGQGSSECKEPAETRERRILELELMHHYITETGPSIAFDKESSSDLFVKAIPRMAFQSDALLYGIYAITTLHQAKTALPSSSTLDHHQQYLQLAFHYHHKELGSFSSENADVILLTTHIMRIIASVMLSERSLVPYTPPSEWLKIASSNAQIFRAAWEMVGNDSSTQLAKLMHSTPLAWDKNKHQREGLGQRQRLQHILIAQNNEESDADDPDCWDIGVREAYESAAGYIGGLLQAMQTCEEPSGQIKRRIMVFPLLVDTRFIDLVTEGRPRALVIMAHYFALVVALESSWFIGDTGAREVKAIASHLPTWWQGFMDLPMRAINGDFTYKS
ncbi:C6 finger domain-containing protein [Arthroderma uncinatum]|uniref:C6 finger domain-containing protein n=1 Tax=Arthroderma uncinatum TaxID=74035 RepID=UPI00144ABF6A|nr:C6 finger domain-containing protein [Arthroderma uncinatum]KAF3492150.1 C6 finger domain-containing protein [Arthroderma uncinatum]